MKAQSGDLKGAGRESNAMYIKHVDIYKQHHNGGVTECTGGETILGRGYGEEKQCHKLGRWRRSLQQNHAPSEISSPAH